MIGRNLWGELIRFFFFFFPSYRGFNKNVGGVFGPLINVIDVTLPLLP